MGKIGNPFLYLTLFLAGMLAVLMINFVQAQEGSWTAPVAPFPENTSSTIKAADSAVDDQQTKFGTLNVSSTLRLIDGEGGIVYDRTPGTQNGLCLAKRPVPPGESPEDYCIEEWAGIPLFFGRPNLSAPKLRGYLPVEVWGETFYTPLYKQAEFLVNAEHTLKECTDAGGRVVDDGNSNFFCRFKRSSCPSGWSWYQSWSQTSANTCTGKGGSVCAPDSCTTGSHPWRNASVESCTYYGVVESFPYGVCVARDKTICSANIGEIGCY